ncbi:hypothetical protein LTR40_006124 [Exophiala xenobiotica]|nr:hypothetical protein LTR40_006124 [Exophiala xenobiotica]
MRERKRAVDRQRASKQRAQVGDHVAALESRLEELGNELEALKRRRSSPHHSPRYEIPKTCEGTLVPIHTVDQATKNRVSLCTTNDISTPFPPLAAPGWTPANRPHRHDGIHIQARSLDSMNPGTAMTSRPSEMSPGPNIGTMSRRTLTMNCDPVMITEPWTDATSLPDAPSRSDPTSASDCQSIFNNLLTTAHAFPSTSVCTDPRLNQDALIRGVLFGWDIVTTMSPFCCPLWDILRHLDKRIFQLSGTITRLCTLRMIHNLLLYLVKATSSESLPPWYRPRSTSPSQYKFPHAQAADVLPWPGLRERAVLCQSLTQTNKFWTEVIYYFRFCWPYTIHEIASLSPGTGLYEFSGMYDHYLYEIRMWKMDMKFFESFPETYDDIIPSLEIERPIQSASVDAPLKCWSAKPWPRPLPLPEDLDEKEENSAQLDQFFSTSDICNWDVVP